MVIPTHLVGDTHRPEGWTVVTVILESSGRTEIVSIHSGLGEFTRPKGTRMGGGTVQSPLLVREGGPLGGGETSDPEVGHAGTVHVGITDDIVMQLGRTIGRIGL